MCVGGGTPESARFELNLHTRSTPPLSILPLSLCLSLHLSLPLSMSLSLPLELIPFFLKTCKARQFRGLAEWWANGPSRWGDCIPQAETPCSFPPPTSSPPPPPASSPVLSWPLGPGQSPHPGNRKPEAVRQWTALWESHNERVHEGGSSLWQRGVGGSGWLGVVGDFRTRTGMQPVSFWQHSALPMCWRQSKQMPYW